MNMMIKNARDVIEKAGLNWKVRKSDVFFNGNFGVEEYKDSKAIVREDNGQVLGIVGSRYVPIQNESVFEFLDKFIDNEDVYYSKANSYKDGRVISVDISLSREDRHTVRVGDDIETLIRVITSHDGSERLSARLLVNRLVCQNGLVRPNTCFAFNTKHTLNAGKAINNGFDLINVARVFGKEMAETARRMANTTTTSAKQREYILKVLNVTEEAIGTKQENKLEEIIALANNGKGNVGRTLWDNYNGVTEYADYHIRTRGDNDRLTSSVLGSGLVLKERAYTIAQEFITV